MTESVVIPFLTREWRLASDIARDVYEAEGERGDLMAVRIRVNRNLRNMERRGKAERKAATEGGGKMTPMMWRLARWTASRGPPSATRSGPGARWT